MTSADFGDDFLVIDTLPSSPLIEIDRPPNYKLFKSCKYKSRLSQYHPYSTNESQGNCHKLHISPNIITTYKKENTDNQTENFLNEDIDSLHVSPIVIDTEIEDLKQKTDCKTVQEVSRSDKKTLQNTHSITKYNKVKQIGHKKNKETICHLNTEGKLQKIQNHSCSHKKMQHKKEYEVIRNSSIKELQLIELDTSDDDDISNKYIKQIGSKTNNTGTSASCSIDSSCKANILISDSSKTNIVENNEMPQISKNLSREFSQSDSDDSDIIPVFETKCASKYFLPLDVTKYTKDNVIIPIFKTSSHKTYIPMNISTDQKNFKNQLEKSKYYVQKREFSSKKPFKKRLSKKFSSDKNVTSYSCTDNNSNSCNSPDHPDIIIINDNPISEANDFKSSSKENFNESSPNISEELLQKDLNDDDDNEYDKEDSSNYDNENMDIDSESDANNIISIENTDYISLKNIKIDDLESCPPINDDVLVKRKNLEALRKWELTGLGTDLLKMNKNFNGCIFTLLSYNALSQRLLLDNMHLYENCNKTYLDWSYRWPLLQHEIRHLQPDIIALQEVESTHYHTHYLPWFKFIGYNCIYKKKTRTKVDGCLIAYNAKKFSVIEENSVEYYQPRGKRYLDRDNVGLIVKFTPTAFHSPFCVATTHLLFNPKRIDVRLAQLTLFLTELDRICYIKEENSIPKYCPVILTGDFNSEPFSPVLKFINHGSVNYSYETHGNALIPSALGVSEYCQHKSLSQGRYLQNLRGELFSLSDKRKIEEELIKLSHSEREKQEADYTNVENSYEAVSGTINHDFKFKSVYYPRLDRLSRARAVTTHQNQWVTVDYIFYSRIIKNEKCIEGNLKLIARYGLLGEKEAEAFGPLPSDVCPSDHFPLAAQFLLKPN